MDRAKRARSGRLAGLAVLAAAFLLAGPGVAPGAVPAPAPPAVPAERPPAASARPIPTSDPKYYDIGQTQVRYRASKEARDPMTFRPPFSLPDEPPPPPPPQPSTPPGAAAPTPPPGRPSEIPKLLEEARGNLAEAKARFHARDFDRCAAACEQVTDLLQRARQGKEPLPDNLRDEAEQFGETAYRLHKAAEGLKAREDLEKEFLAFPIIVQALVWRQEGDSWAVINGELFSEREIRARRPVPGLVKRVTVARLERSGILFLYQGLPVRRLVTPEIGGAVVATGTEGLEGTGAPAPGAAPPAAPPAPAAPAPAGLPGVPWWRSGAAPGTFVGGEATSTIPLPPSAPGGQRKPPQEVPGGTGGEGGGSGGWDLFESGGKK